MQLSNPSSQDITVTYSAAKEAGDTADAGVDFTASTDATIPINSPNTTAEITVPILVDTIYEGNETFTVTVKSFAPGAPSPAAQFATGVSDIPVVVTIEDNEDEPVLSVASQTLTIGEEDGPLTFNVSLTPATIEDTVIVYSTDVGTASSLDFTGQSNQEVTIDAGDTELASGSLISIPITSDDIREGNETFNVTLSIKDAANKIAKIVGIPETIVISVTITDDDASDTPTVSITNTQSTLTEASGNLSVSLALSHATTQTVSIPYTISVGNATRGADFIAPASGTAFITSGTTGSITIPIVDDNIAEGDETFTVTLGTLVNAAPGSKVMQEFTIQDDDTATLSVKDDTTDVSVVEGNGTAKAQIVVELNKPAKQDVMVNYTVADVSTESGDYTDDGSGSITISSGDTSGIISLTIGNDAVYEGNETFTVTINSATNVSNTNAQGLSAITVTIVDDEAKSTLTAPATVSVTETNPGTNTNATFNLTLNPVSETNVVVSFSTSNGSAVGSADGTNADYTTQTTQTATIRAGQSEINDQTGTATPISIPITPDELQEGNETFFVTLTIQNPDATKAKIEGNPAEIVLPVTITDDETTDPVVRFTNQAATIAENAGSSFAVEIEVSHETTKTVAVAYQITADSGQATIGEDFIAPTSGVAKITSGTTTSIPVPILDDETYEGDETFKVELMGTPTNATLETTVANRTKEFTISENEEIPEIGFVLPLRINESAGANGKIPVRLNRPAKNNITANYSTTTRTSDFVMGSGSVTFTKGTTRAEIPIELVDDDVHESSSETVSVTLSGIVGDAIFINQAASYGEDFTIIDDDQEPIVLAPSHVYVQEGADTEINLKLSRQSYQRIEVRFSTSIEGSDTAEVNDFTAQTNITEPIAPNGESLQLIVPTNGDSIYEGNETFTVTLNMVSNSSFQGGADAVTIPVTIIEDDPRPILTTMQTSLSHKESDNVTVNFSIAGTAENDITVTPRVVYGSATAGDFANTPGAATITGGTANGSGTITYQIGTQAAFERIEEYDLEIKVSNNAQVEGVGSRILIPGQISDNPTEITVFEDSLMVSDTAGTAKIKVNLTDPAPADFVLSYYTEVKTTDTADASDEDFTSIASGSKSTVNVSAGDTSATLSITVKDDTDSDDETFTLHMEVPNNSSAIFGTGSSANGTKLEKQVTIKDSGSVSTYIGFADTTVRVAEDNANGSVSLAFAPNPAVQSVSPVTFTYYTVDGTATAGSDYTSSGTQASQTSITLNGSSDATEITISLTDDGAVEGDEQFIVKLSSTDAVFNNGTGSQDITVIIESEDVQTSTPVLSVSAGTGTEADEKADITLSLSLAASSSNVEVTYSTSIATGGATPDTANNNDVAIQTNAKVIIPQGETSGILSIPIVNDEIAEGTETFTFSITGISGATTSFMLNTD